MLHKLFEIIMHFDQHLNFMIQSFGLWTYLFLFLIIFAETGLVVTPFLPGDSLLFTVGAFSAAGSLNITWIFLLLATAGILGDGVNYAVGKYLSEEVFQKTLGRFVKKEHLDKTHAFYEKYGSKTIVLARFVPIVRTLAPFVAGIGKMNYAKFAVYNVSGCLLWVGSLTFAGYLFGNIPLVKNNFSMVILGIIFVSILPAVIEYGRHAFGGRAAR